MGARRREDLRKIADPKTEVMATDHLDNTIMTSLFDMKPPVDSLMINKTKKRKKKKKKRSRARRRSQNRQSDRFSSGEFCSGLFQVVPNSGHYSVPVDGER